MFKKLTEFIGGDPIRRQIEAYSEIVQQINALEPEMQRLEDQALRSKTEAFRDRLAQGESPDDLLVEAFAVVREAAVRTIGLRHYDVQLIGGLILHEGMIAEMKTGEGKTLVATMPIYLNALSGGGVHLVTVNDYLARRDARWMGPIFDYLGLSVGVLQEAARTEGGRKAFLYDPSHESSQEDVHQLRIVDRKLAYAADVTYGTNNEFGFDYLRDNMARSLEARVQRGHFYAILDEVDNILIDEARTPLIISGPAHEDPEQYQRMASIVTQLRPEDFEISERDRTVSLTEIGEDHVERLLGEPLRDPDRPEDITPEQARLLGHLEQALRAEYLYKRNKQYVVQGGRVIIVDEFTGRMMAGRRWSDGLHQAVEAKEGVRIRQENVTYATITLQNYFRMYEKLAGMTGTAVTEAEEFNKIYKVDVTPLPTNLEFIALMPNTDLVEVEYRENGSRFIYYARPDDEQQAPVFWKRRDYPDLVYRTEESKFRSLVTEILRRHVVGQPMLVGTTSVELSERLSGRLSAASLKRLALVLVLRDAYLEAKDIPDDGMRVEALDPLYQPLDMLRNAELRTFAKEAGVALNATRPENLERLRLLLDLPPGIEEQLAAVLESGIKHNVLNAKKHDEESRIIADAGALGAVTIATNMAGRGVDIKLGGEIAEEVLAAVNRVLRRIGIDEPEHLNLEERFDTLRQADDEAIGIYGPEIDLFRNFMEDQRKVREVGGLHVIGSERHESRRIDNQLRGRAARQGDPGSSRFFLSMEDELMRLFGGTQVSGIMQRLNIDDAVPIEHGIVDRTIEQAQTRVEGANFDTRKHLLEYDDVLNQQREVFYTQRNRVFSKDDLLDDVHAMINAEVERHLAPVLDDPEGAWKLLAWLEETQPTLNLDSEAPYPSFMIALLLGQLDAANRGSEVKAALLSIAEDALNSNLEYLSRSVDEQLDRAVDRLNDQARQRVEMAELAYEGVLLDAEERGASPNSRELVQAVENAVGMRIQMDDLGLDQIAEDPGRFRQLIPDFIEAGLGLRIWGGLVRAVESRVGESLELDEKLAVPIDWDATADRLQDALEAAWSRRAERTLQDARRELDASLRDDGSIGRAEKIRALVHLSYGRRTFFDRKTHQRREMLYARLTYAFNAAELLAGKELEDLTAEVTAHLEGGQRALEDSLGQSEFFRLSSNRIDEIDDRLQRRLRRTLGEEAFAELAEQGLMSSLPEDSQQQIRQALGQSLLTETYRGLILSVSDQLWVDYLTQMEALRTSIGLEAYGQRDPLVQYKSRAFDLFQQLLTDIRAGVVSRLYRAQPVSLAQTAAASADGAASGVSQPARSGGRKRKRRRRRR